LAGESIVPAAADDALPSSAHPMEYDPNPDTDTDTDFDYLRSPSPS
jgi:hypothetical protein